MQALKVQPRGIVRWGSVDVSARGDAITLHGWDDVCRDVAGCAQHQYHQQQLGDEESASACCPSEPGGNCGEEKDQSAEEADCVENAQRCANHDACFMS